MDPVTVSIPKEEFLPIAQKQLEDLQKVCHFVVTRGPRKRKGETWLAYLKRKKASPWYPVNATVAKLRDEQRAMVQLLER